MGSVQGDESYPLTGQFTIPQQELGILLARYCLPRKLGNTPQVSGMFIARYSAHCAPNREFLGHHIHYFWGALHGKLPNAGEERSDGRVYSDQNVEERVQQVQVSVPLYHY